ncbi:Vacuolar protein sorting/targeting protein 10 [Hondaea fermentalgiana]|uniref:Vacuolar protein sorting/targeting protein 10 n=1 Tax=Hondaea fermentalgiana TaxID=2315210 RepID=A0A2R5GIU5_9STRA|nr:Vacuolar protein sorting/targeting protein 10 [Hondaea fermentalgiana]|eukprot:GBG30812.1 Vacuolar protein sorting/targeting protein 10 [Hondaea fermentalgiana]
MGRFLRVAAAVALATLVATAAGDENLIKQYDYEFNGEVDDMRWVGARKSTVLVLTNAMDIHRSLNSGITFEKLGPAQLPAPESGSLAAEDAQIRRIIQHPSNPDVVCLISKGVVQYFSSDGGASFRTFRTPAPVAELHLHPTISTLMLVTAYSPKCRMTPAPNSKPSSANDLDDGKDANGKEACYKALYMSENAGKSFSLLRKYVVQADWFDRLAASERGLGRVQNTGEQTTSADEAGWHLFDRNKKSLATHDPKTVLVTTNPTQNTGDQHFGSWDVDVSLILSEDKFKSERTLVPGGNKFLFTQHFIFVAQVSTDGRSPVKLLMSADRCASFYEAQMPFRLTQKSFTILDSNTGVVFLHVNHLHDSYGYGHVYVSDSTGGNYTFSLRDNVRNHGGRCDFDRILSIEGVYMANYVDNVEELENFAAARREREDESDGSDTEGNQMVGSHQVKLRRPATQVKTVISFDRGGEWTLLRAPTVDANSKPITCATSDCGLHLHGHGTPYAPIYSSPAAVGIIMGVGNVGTHLSSREGEESTYLSSDGGVSWSEIRKGSHIYEIGAHGELILMARDDQPTTSLIYSWDHGKTWTEIQFSQQPMDVENIIVEPSAVSRVFHIFGFSAGSSEKGVIITLDFSGLHQRECTGASMPQNPTSDYELWSPRDADAEGLGAGSTCHLGREVTYLRRKCDARCFTPMQFEAKRFVRNCACSERDYECDFGFRRNVAHGPCVRDPSVANETLGPPEECPESGFYSISNGYRLVGGNTCEGGKNLGPTTFSCTRGVFGVSRGGWAVLFIIFGMVAIMLYMNFKQRKGPLDSFGTQDFGNDVKSCWEIFKESVRLRRTGTFSGMRYSRMHSPDGQAGMDFADADMGDDDMHDSHSFVDDVASDGDFNEDFDEPQLISTRDADHDKALRYRHTPTPAASVPVLRAPPTAASLDIFGEDDGGDKGDIV